MTVSAVLAMLIAACGPLGDDDGDPDNTPPVCTTPDPAGDDALAVKVQETTGQKLLHWCDDVLPIPVTYNGLSATGITLMNDALAAMDAIGCWSLSFGTPSTNPDPPTTPDDLRLHFVTLDPADSQASTTDKTFSTDTGEIFFGTVSFKESSSVDHRVVRAIGNALGLETPPNGTDSMMALDYGGAASPTADDIATLCFLYPAP